MNIYQYGKRIKELRNQNSLTQQQLADMVGVSAKTVSHWETGYTMPDVEMMLKLAEVFNISLNDLVNEQSDLPQQQVIEDYSGQYKKNSGRISRLNWFQKAVLVFVTAMSIIFTVIYIIVSSREGFLYKNVILTPSQQNNETIYSGKISGEQVTFTVNGNTLLHTYGENTYGPYVLTEDPSAIPENHGWSEIMTGIEIKKQNNIIFRGGAVKVSNGEWVLYNKDGSIGNDVSVFESSGNTSAILKADVIAALILGPELTHKGNLVRLFFGLILCIVIAMSILFENEIFHWQLSFQIRNAEKAEPSDYEIVTRYASWAIIPLLVLQLFIAGLK